MVQGKWTVMALRQGLKPLSTGAGEVEGEMKPTARASSIYSSII